MKSNFRRRLSCMLAALSVATGVAPGVLASPPASPKTPEWKVWGHSVKDRPILVRRSGDTASPFKVLVVGSIHGDEPEGIRVVDRLNRHFHKGLKGVDLWTIRTINPDGTKRGTRGNAHGVDLNRNFSLNFNATLEGGYESGPRPFSEPESRTAARIAIHGDFDIAIWYHQPWGNTLVPCNDVRRVAWRYAELSGLDGTRECDRYVPGSAIGWMHHEFGTAAFVVEFGPGRISSHQVRRHARAVMKLAKEERPDPQ